MATQNVSTQAAEGNNPRKILSTAIEVHVHSLPWSLRHYSTACALEEALDLCVFLQDVTFLAESFKDDDPFDEAGARGLMHVQRLLRDKLEIGMGRYKFPMLQHGNDVPALVKREEE